MGRLLAKRRQPITMTRLAYGDVAFLGNGPGGRPVTVGIEYKTVSDALACVIDGRFAGHQLPGLHQSYEAVFLLLEGDTRPDPQDGVLKVRHQRGFWYSGKIGTRVFMYRELDHWLMTLSLRAGVRVLRTSDIDGSAQTVIDLFSWFTGKEWEDHRSHMALTDAFRNDVDLVKPGLVRRVSKELPSIGWDRSRAVAKRFRSVFEMCMADEADWSQLEGIGKTPAAAVVRAIRGEGGGGGGNGL